MKNSSRDRRDCVISNDFFLFVSFAQVYKGLDVATNKATEEETDGVPHHMMGTLDWDDVCNVHEYRKEALKIVSFFFFFYFFTVRF